MALEFNAGNCSLYHEAYIPMQTMLLIAVSEYVFHLTGSQFFGNSRIDSDWDFFTQECPEVRVFLEGAGFDLVTENIHLYPDDPNIAEVWGKGLVHIQLVRDVSLKLAAQKILYELPFSGFQKFRASKHEAREWWRWAYRMAQV